MIDGIIQKVFKPYLEVNLSIEDRKRLTDIQQELIEEIKKAFPKSQLIKHDVQWKLIGSPHRV